MPARQPSDKFLVAFSFAGEQRDLVRAIAEAVEKKLGHNTVFLDEWFEHWLAGADADLKLQKIYGRGCALAVVCISEHYGNKPWTRHEHAAVRARVIQARTASDDREQSGILPIRVGDGDVEGILFTDIVPDVRTRSADQAAELVVDRLRLVIPDLKTKSDDTPTAPGRAVPERDSWKPKRIWAAAAVVAAVLLLGAFLLFRSGIPKAEIECSVAEVGQNMENLGVKETLVRPEQDGTVRFAITLANKSKVQAKNGSVFLRICEACEFAEEPPGFYKQLVEKNQDREMDFPTLHAYTGWPIPLRIRIPPGSRQFAVGVTSRCENCVFRPTETLLIRY